MKIRSIHIKNVKCFDDYELNLTDGKDILQMCSLVGTNGSGKSTILQAIVAGFTAFSKDYGGDALPIGAIRIDSDGEAYIRIELELSEEEKILLNETGYNGLHEIILTKTEKNTFIYLPGDWDDDKAGNAVEEYQKFRQEFSKNNRAGTIMYFDAFRFLTAQNPAGPGIENSLTNPKVDALESSVRKGGKITSRYYNLKQWMVNLDYSILKNPTRKNQDMLRHMKKALNALCKPLIFECIREDGMILMKDTELNQTIEIDMLSDGFKSLFVIITEMIFRLSATIPDDSDEVFYEREAVVLIDELDCHIHPKWQKNLVPALKKLFPNCQFIITTHSPYILGTLQDCEIRKLGGKSLE